MDYLAIVFSYAKRRYPHSYIDLTTPTIHIWRLVDAATFSGDASQHGQLVLQEWRGDAMRPWHHWECVVREGEVRA